MKKLFKTIFFITLALILIFVLFLTVSVVSGFSNESPNAGIIGGADAPTAIFIIQTIVLSNPVIGLLSFAAILFIASAVGWGITKNK